MHLQADPGAARAASLATGLPPRSAAMGAGYDEASEQADISHHRRPQRQAPGSGASVTRRVHRIDARGRAARSPVTSPRSALPAKPGPAPSSPLG
jgi:hypothetical protein